MPEVERYRLASVKGYVGKLVKDRTGGIVLYPDHLDEVERVEMEELDKHADLTAQFAAKLTEVEAKLEERLSRARRDANEAAPAIREQERERMREALLAKAAGHPDRTRLRVFIQAALDPLEDDDGS